MLVNEVIETPEGHIKFEGELEPKELQLVLQIGLNYLYQMGALPFMNKGAVANAAIDMEVHPEQ